MVVRALAAAAVCSGALGSAQQPLSLPSLCTDCLPEPLEVEYFGGTPGGEPRRLVQPSREEFNQAARAGQVLLIENASAGTAMEGWSCARLAQEFPEARMRREYDWVKNPEDRNLQKIGGAGKAWIETAEAGEDAQERLQQDPKAPPFAPFYWGVREHQQGQIGSKKVVRRVRELIAASVPSFMDAANADSLFDNAEFWLGAKGTGARAHMDSHCISTLSVVLKGERRWRIGPVPRMPKDAGRSRGQDVVFDDGVAYKLGWKPLFEFTAREGEAVLFPPGWIHETLNTAEGCTVALTTQFNVPRPTGYFREFYQRLRRVGDLHPCWPQMRRWGSLGEKAKKGQKFSLADAQAHARELFRLKNSTLGPDEVSFFDRDGDGHLTEEEFVEVYSMLQATERAVQKERAVDMPRPDMSLERPGTGSSSGRSKARGSGGEL